MLEETSKVIKGHASPSPTRNRGKHCKQHLFWRQKFKGDLRNKQSCHFIGPNRVDVWNVHYVRFGFERPLAYTSYSIPLHSIQWAQLFMINLNNSTVRHKERKTTLEGLLPSNLLHVGGTSSCGSVVFVFCWRTFCRGLPFMRSHKHLRIIKQQHGAAVKPRQDGQSKSF